MELKTPLITLIATMVSQGLFFVCIFLINKLFGPASLGQFNKLLSVGMFVGTVAALRYDLACVSTSPGKSFNAMVHVFPLGIAVSMLLALVLYPTGEIPFVACLFAIGFLSQLLLTSYYSSARKFHFGNLPRTVASAIFLAALPFLMRSKATDGNSLFVYYTFATLASTALFVIFIWRRESENLALETDFFWEHRRFALLTLPSTLCNSVFHYALPIVIPDWFGDEIAGHFAFAYRFGFFPVSLCSQSIAGIIRRESMAALAVPDGGTKLMDFVWSYFKALIVLSGLYALVAVVVAVVAQRAFGPNKWTASADYLLCMVPMFVGQLVFMPMSQTFLVTKAQRTDFLIQFTTALSLIGVLGISRYFAFSAIQATLAFSLVGAAIMLAGSVIVITTLKAFLKTPASVTS
ncbi:lipopolysaccharide biosynthesis protein [Singulisphaera sp. PoT]|uniref:lipopolysaccharide biosynthesis protein n=1 Tax=Singulisphaera sp. PoT TaxID=3411797 RepID=UPI003BF4C44F